MTDRIVLAGMRFVGRHGVLPEERAQGQPFLVDVELEGDLRRAGARDELAYTVDYRQVYAAVRSVLEGEPKQLLEALAEEIATQLLVLERVAAVTVRVRKPQVVLPGPLDYSAVEIRRVRRRSRGAGNDR
jgi:7,8-dihydroneopterin aldolase/epimerase/oxygenase